MSDLNLNKSLAIVSNAALAGDMLAKSVVAFLHRSGDVRHPTVVQMRMALEAGLAGYQSAQVVEPNSLSEAMAVVSAAAFSGQGLSHSVQGFLSATKAVTEDNLEFAQMHGALQARLSDYQRGVMTAR